MQSATEFPPVGRSFSPDGLRAIGAEARRHSRDPIFESVAYLPQVLLLILTDWGFSVVRSRRGVQEFGDDSISPIPACRDRAG